MIAPVSVAHYIDGAAIITAMKIIADLCVTPLGDGTSVSDSISECIRILRDAGLDTRTHAYGTNVEGNWDEVFAALKACHEYLHDNGTERISTSIRLGTRTDKFQSLDDKITAVMRKANRVETEDRQFLIPEPTTSKFMEIKQSDIHSNGAVALLDIEEGTRVIEYVGRKVDKDEADRIYEGSLEAHQKDKSKGSVYLFVLNDQWDVDGDVEWNTARNLNHSCDPNCETDIIDNRIWIMANRDISAGEELTYDYGYDFDNWEDHPCLCGTDKCIGYIISLDDHMKLFKILTEKGETPPGSYWKSVEIKPQTKGSKKKKKRKARS